MSTRKARRDFLASAGLGALAVAATTGRASAAPVTEEPAVPPPKPGAGGEPEDGKGDAPPAKRPLSPPSKASGEKQAVTAQPTPPPPPSKVPDSSAAGKAVLPRDDEKAWSRIETAFRRLYAFDGAGNDSLVDAFRDTALSIDTGFSFSAEPEDVALRFHHVEPLLNQIAELLERAIRIRVTWDDAAQRAFQLGLDLFEYVEIEKIHQEETAAGCYTVQARVAALELAAERQISWATNSAAEILEGLLKERWSNDEINRQSGASQLAAWLSHLATYEGQAVGSPIKYTWNGVGKTSWEHMHESATTTSFHMLGTQLDTLSVQSILQHGTARAAGLRADAALIRREWEDRQTGFRRRRASVAKRQGDFRVRAASEPGGVLNYSEKLTSLKLRFDRDLRDAVARMMPARDGLERVYGRPSPLPTSVTKLIVDPKATATPGGHLFDDCLFWVRDAISWLTRFSQLDQRAVHTVSLRRSIGETAWSAGVRSGEWALELAEHDFPGEKVLRLRGISMSVDSATAGRALGTWRGKVRVPERGSVQHLSLKKVVLDQRTVPVCRVGRIWGWDVPREPDVVGHVALHNCSPLGKWKVSLAKSSTSGKALSDLEDVLLDLHLAFQT